MIELSRHRNGIRVFNMVFTYYLSRSQRRSMRELFYGPQFAEIRTKLPDKVVTLEMAFRSHPDEKPRILKDLHDSLLPAIEVGILQLCPFSHKLVLQYLRNVFETDENAHVFLMKVVSCFTLMIQQRDDVIAGLHCIPHFPLEFQLQLFQSTKSDMKGFFKDQYQHAIVLDFMDCVDIDFKLIESAILQEYLKDLKTNLQDVYAKQIVLYTIVNTSSVLLTSLHAFSKKKASIKKNQKNHRDIEKRKRASAIFVYFLPKIVEYVEENARDCLLDQCSNQIIAHLIIMNMHEIIDSDDLASKTTFTSLADTQMKLHRLMISVLIQCNCNELVNDVVECDNEIGNKKRHAKESLRRNKKQKQ